MYSVPFSNYEGISLLSNFRLGPMDIASNIIGGRIDEELVSPGQSLGIQVKNFVGFNISATWEGISAYVAYFEDTVEIDSAPLQQLGQLLQTPSPMNSTPASESDVSQLLFDDDKGLFLGYGASADYFNFLLEGEFSKTEVEDSSSLDQEQWYVSLSYRFPKIQPYLMYAQRESERNTSTASRFSPGFQQDAVQRTFDASLFEYNAWTLGARFEVHSAAVLKVELNLFQDIIDNNSSSAFGIRTFSPLDSEKETGSINEFSVGLDVVF